MVQPASRSLGLTFNTDERNAVTLNTSLDYEDGRAGGREVSASLGVDVRPTEKLAVSLGPSYLKETDVRQYVRAVEDPAFDPTFGRRYFFGDLRREELAMEARFDVILSPTLTIEVFAQPLISAGDFRAYKQLAQASTFDFIRFEEGEAASDGEQRCASGDLCRADGTVFVDYTGDGDVDASFRDQSFNVRSLRGNAVLRWEFRPGSRLFVVWQQERQMRDAHGTFDFSSDARALFDAPGEHTFMIKVDYWLDL